MKKYFTVATLSLLAVSGLVAQLVVSEPEKKEVAVAPIQTLSLTGEEKVAQIRSDYLAGRYDEMLSELSGDYEKLVKDGHAADLIKMREAPPEDENLKLLAAKWEATHQALLDERNTSLQGACKESKEERICKLIASALSQSTVSSEEKEAMRYLSSLRFKTPDQAMSDDERALIDIDVATEFKTLHLDAQYAAKPFDNRYEKQVVIKMAMFQEMQGAAKNFSDQALARKVDLAATQLDAWQACNLDAVQLNALVKKPSSELEKKIASIISGYQAKKEDLYQKEFLAKLDV
jgi:hypothetical protein